ncbi:MAG: AAA family ATPase, partial [Myxococcota bacterium]
MRLVAIRGAHLASLGPFTLELDTPPLADSRIFAIVGPTGAGKSTLLDAVCLALYDRVPRLMDARDAVLGIDDLSPSDPRALMRRGATEAFAEVDFIDRNGTRCRARWDVWRARKRVDGRMQNQRMALHDLDANRELTGSTKTETLRQIETRLGLSFDEFRRAVLLAQGDFAAFLRAPADERAHLLEKMTGTHLFGAISRAAFGRCREAEQALKSAETEQAAVDVLSAEAIADLETARTKYIADKTTETTRRNEADVALRWFDELDRVTATANEARSVRTEAREAATAAQATRELLAHAERAARLRSPFEAFERAQREHTQTQLRLREAKASLETARSAAVTAEQRLQTAETQRRALRARYEAEAEAVARARDLDGRVAEAKETATRLTAQTEARQTEMLKARSALDAALERMEAADTALKAQQRWILDNSALRDVAAQWSNHDADLEQAEILLARVRAVDVDAQKIEARWHDLSTASAEADNAAKVAMTELTKAQDVLRTRQAALTELRARVPPKDRRDAMETLAELRAGLERLMTLLPNARRLDRRIREEARARRAAIKHAKEAKSRVDQARTQANKIKASLETAS